MVIMKAAQMGVSTVALARMLHWCLLGRKVGYYLPTREFMVRFVQDRLDPLINAHPELARATLEGKAYDDASAARLRRKSADNVRLKHIGPGSAWLMGLQKLTEAKSVDLDAVLLDELNELDPRLALWVEDRLLHSDFKRHWSLSQPSVPDFGIHAAYLASDRKRWLIRCRRCRRWCDLPADFPDCLVRHKSGEWRIVCTRCGARVHRANGQWVAENPEASVSGYQLSQLYGPHITPDEIAARWQRAQRDSTALENFRISILGLPHAGDRQPLSEDVLSAACDADRLLGPLPGARALYAGIDQGDVNHIAIAALDADDTLRVVWAEATPHWERLEALLRQFNVSFFVIDAMPSKTLAKRLCHAEGLHGAICYFTGEGLRTSFEDEQTATPTLVVKVDRTEAIDAMADAVRAGSLRLPSARLDVVHTIKQHCKRLVKTLRPDGRFDYARGVENHFGLALTYLHLAAEAARAHGLGPVVH
ncbi:MAG: phage terminase large subunit family protein, partial [Armatimonadetes bacterium]|nr:phage terminase large subunit family protein [Armatimonadota bacterium]